MTISEKIVNLFYKGKNSIINKYYNIREIIGYLLHKNAFVFGAPFHSNAGDQAQTYCIERWIKYNYPKYSVRIFNTDVLALDDYKKLKLIRKIIKKNDLIFLHSGYHTTDLYMLEEHTQRKVVQLFPDKKIVILPQTIYYKNHIEEKKAINIYNNHPNLLLMCRDDVSYNIAERIFPNCKLILFPDIVTTLIGTQTYNSERAGILLCVRNDQEALLKKNELDLLVKELSHIDKVQITDTTLSISGYEFSENREKILKEMWKKYSQYKVIVTDRYHGTIFSLIANTPVIVMPSTDHKLSSGVKWFPKSFNDYVHYVDDFSNIINVVEKVYNKKYDYKLPNYFNKKYYSELKSIIEV